MKKTRKILLMAACAVLLVCISVGATVAYLTDMEQVVNTFTVGKVAITLDEKDVTLMGEPDTQNTARVNVNDYKLMPGRSYIKDPTVHFLPGSDESWLFVKVEMPSGFTNIEGDYITDKGENVGTIGEQIEGNGWETLGNAYPGIYYKHQDANNGYDNIDIPVFYGFKIGDAVESTALNVIKPATTGTDETDNNELKVTAYAVQADGFATAKAAWDATFGTPSTNP